MTYESPLDTDDSTDAQIQHAMGAARRRALRDIVDYLTLGDNQ